MAKLFKVSERTIAAWRNAGFIKGVAIKAGQLGTAVLFSLESIAANNSEFYDLVNRKKRVRLVNLFARMRARKGFITLSDAHVQARARGLEISYRNLVEWAEKWRNQREESSESGTKVEERAYQVGRTWYVNTGAFIARVGEKVNSRASFTVEKLAGKLGVSRDSVRRAINSGLIVATVGKRGFENGTRIPATEANAWISNVHGDRREQLRNHFFSAEDALVRVQTAHAHAFNGLVLNLQKVSSARAAEDAKFVALSVLKLPTIRQQRLYLNALALAPVHARNIAIRFSWAHGMDERAKMLNTIQVLSLSDPSKQAVLARRFLSSWMQPSIK